MISEQPRRDMEWMANRYEALATTVEELEGFGQPKHGEDALIHAAERADDLLEAGDTDGAAIWRAIMGTIEELRRDRGPGESLN